MADDEGCPEDGRAAGSAGASANWSWRQRGGEALAVTAMADGLRRLAEAFDRRGIALRRVHLEIVDDARMDAYHRQFSGVPGTTDVLTFCESDDAAMASDPDASEDTAPRPVALAVDLIICADEAARRAREFGHPVEREVLLYAVHGVLHCLGHDDHEPLAYERMHAEEDAILEAAGIGATFRPQGLPAPADASVERGAS